jgi:hypothetical protein
MPKSANQIRVKTLASPMPPRCSQKRRASASWGAESDSPASLSAA